jgi:flagellar protein FlgJ
MMDGFADMALDQAASFALGSRPTLPKGGSQQAIREAAVEFEAVFAAQMLKPMFDELDSDGMFGGGHAESVFRSLLVQEIGEKVASRGELGIADAMTAELLRIQEGQAAQAAAQIAATGTPKETGR